MGQTDLEISAGGVLYRLEEGEPHVAIVHVKKWRGWGLPKGHVEKGESLEEAALREVGEETGVQGKIIQKIDMIEYVYPEGARRVHKKVYYYLMEYQKGTTDDHDTEVSKAEWMSFDRALKVLKYDNDKKILRRAKTLLKHLF